MASFDYQSSIDLKRYPIDQLRSKSAQSLVRDARTALKKYGACELEGFLTVQAVQTAVAQCRSLAAQAHPSRSRATAYLTSPEAGYPSDHPRTLTMDSSVRVIGYDQIPLSHLTRQLYEWPPLMTFIAEVLELPRLYHYADPMGALNLALMGAGDALGWHYDQTDFVTSIPLVSAQAGGAFEVYPLIRNADDENYQAVAAAIHGETEPPLHFAMHPGALLLFKGRHSLHRVTPVAGERDRIVALLAYDRAAGTQSSAELKLARYGRTVPLPTSP